GIEKALPSKSEIEERSQLFKALAEPMRQKILYAVIEQPLCACLLREMLDISDSKLSYHLTILKDAGLIEGSKQGSWIIYRPTCLGEKWTGIMKNI
ncbi:MAG: winged helix-turn-helix transcriptional regulator, partial [Thermoplasmata archaeon]|nr:winged helix-turn-helix transcriptional regulator [Thermoplasmata archaeon]